MTLVFYFYFYCNCLSGRDHDLMFTIAVCFASDSQCVFSLELTGQMFSVYV